MLLGDLLLAALDHLVEELDDLAALEAHHMIMVLLLRDLEHGVPPIEVVTDHQARRLELGQHTIDGGEANVFTGIQQSLVDILGAQVMLALGIFQDLQNLDARQGHLETGLA